jgi:hypothetical protein
MMMEKGGKITQWKVVIYGRVEGRCEGGDFERAE